MLPWGTFTVNMAGSFILGVIAAIVVRGGPGWLLTVAGTGFCGALTTFSTLVLTSAGILSALSARNFSVE